VPQPWSHFHPENRGLSFVVSAPTHRPNNAHLQFLGDAFRVGVLSKRVCIAYPAPSKGSDIHRLLRCFVPTYISTIPNPMNLGNAEAHNSGHYAAFHD
jgi:hypothetical protein